ncbi:MAG: hypothetical protein JW751_16275 [Polyangiaceae bacterium]|nr:hypothetical protein [Polyangiaceae bacterium]
MAPVRRGVPVWLFLLAVVVAAGAGVAVPVPDRAVRAWFEQPAPQPSVPASTSAPPPSASAPPPSASSVLPPPLKLTVEERAARGDEDARATLDGIAPAKLTVAQSVALARGDTAIQQAELTALGERMKADPLLADHPETLAKLLTFARDPVTTVAAQELIAAQQRSTTTDLLYEIWTGVPGRTPATILAERLVLSQAVRAHASPALAVALELREVEDCESAERLVATAGEVGDRRAIRGLQRLVTKKDCGDNGRDYCFPCYRAPQGRRTIGITITTLQRREAPQF